MDLGGAVAAAAEGQPGEAAGRGVPRPRGRGARGPRPPRGRPPRGPCGPGSAGAGGRTARPARRGRPRPGASTSASRSSGRSSSARAMTRACSRLTVPARSPARTRCQRCSSASATRPSARAVPWLAAGVVGQPGGRAAGAVVVGHVVGDGQHPQQHPVQAVGGPGQLDEGLGLLARSSSAPGRRPRLVHRRVHPRGARQHRVARGSGELVHVPTLGPTTDIFEHLFELAENALRTVGCGRTVARPGACPRSSLHAARRWWPRLGGVDWRQ